MYACLSSNSRRKQQEYQHGAHLCFSGQSSWSSQWRRLQDLSWRFLRLICPIISPTNATTISGWLGTTSGTKSPWLQTCSHFWTSDLHDFRTVYLVYSILCRQCASQPNTVTKTVIIGSSNRIVLCYNPCWQKNESRIYSGADLASKARVLNDSEVHLPENVLWSLKRSEIIEMKGTIK